MIRRDFFKTATAACLALVCPMSGVRQSGKILAVPAKWRVFNCGNRSGKTLAAAVIIGGMNGCCRTGKTMPVVLLPSDSVALVFDGLDVSVEVGSRRS